MKVVFKNRFDCFKTPGGDTVQMLQTKLHLEKIGIQVDVSLSPYDDISSYDIVHVFNLLRPLEATVAIKQAKRLSKKIVFSSIYWDFTEFNLVGRGSLFFSLLNKTLSEFNVEKLKDCKRARGVDITKKDLFNYLLSDFKETLKYVDLFLPNSKGEGDIVKDKVVKDTKIHVVNNAVDSEAFFLSNTGKRKFNSLTVARLDPRKNILKLVEAVNSYPLDIYGSSTPNHKKYKNAILKKAKSNVSMKGFVDSTFLAEIYNRYAVHILPSWLETPGLSQLEAAACGCNIVSTNRGSTYEYFEDKAIYCEPGSVGSIRDAVEICFDNLRSPTEMSEFVLDQYTWEKTAMQTLSAYQKVLST